MHTERRGDFVDDSQTRKNLSGLLVDIADLLNRHFLGKDLVIGISLYELLNIHQQDKTVGIHIQMVWAVFLEWGLHLHGCAFKAE